MNLMAVSRRVGRLAIFLSLLFELTSQATPGASRQITLPATLGGVVGSPRQIGFVHRGEVGLVVGGTAGTAPHLVSFMISGGVVSDDLVLNDFPAASPSAPGVHGMSVNDQSGLAVIFGQGANQAQTVVAVAADAAGRLTLKWTVSYPNPLGGQAEAISNADGSVVYVFYNDSSPKVDKIRAADGFVLATIQLDDFDIDAGLTFNAVLRRLIVKTGFYFHVLKAEDDFAVDWRLPSPDDLKLMKRGVISADGHFLIGYGGYAFPARTNIFMTLNMASHEIRLLDLDGKLAPSDAALTFAPDLASLIVPYSSTVKVKKSQVSGCACGTRITDWLAVNADGTLMRTLTTQLPGDQDSIGPLNNAALSRTSAMVFLATSTNRLFAADTLTGEVIADQEVGPVYFIYRIGDRDTFLTTNGTNVLNLWDLQTGPSVHKLTLKKRKLTIEGENFLSGIQVQINGVATGMVNRDPVRPGQKMTVRLDKKDVPTGTPMQVVLVNRDGLSSDPITVNP